MTSSLCRRLVSSICDRSRLLSRRWAELKLLTGGAGAAALLLGAACAPALDWREMRLGESGLRAAFPCRPDAQVRSVSLAGSTVMLALQVCKAGDTTFAVSHADVVDPARVPAALQALRSAAQANLGAPASPAVAGWQVPGMTPQPSGGRWHLQGTLPDGGAIEGEVAVFSRGTLVVQATVLGRALAPASLQPFFDGLRFAD